MNPHKGSQRPKTPGWLWGGILLILVGVWPMKWKQESRKDKIVSPDEKTQRGVKGESTLPFQTNSRIVNLAAKTATTGAASSQKGAASLAGRVDKETMLRQLRGWIRKQEGIEVEIVTSQDVFDMNGNPASLNVIVTTQLNGQLTAESLKNQLAQAIEKELGLREQLARAHRERNINSVNRLVAELVDSRTQFVSNNEVSSYKLSLIKDLPPVLAYWPGMPFETVREAAARALAESKLGPASGLQSLVHFTSATALLQFTNSVGKSVYVDPYRMIEIPADLIKNAHLRARSHDPEGREARIASQWIEYLGQ